MTRAEAETRAAQMHFEAMVRLQQKEEAALQAKREEEALATQRMKRTTGTHGSAAESGERLYRRALEQQAKLERKAVERQRELLDAEMHDSTFAPKISQRAACLRTDGRPVEQRTMEWHEWKNAKQAEAAAASPTARAAHTTSSPEHRRRSAGSANPTITAGKPRTVDSF